MSGNTVVKLDPNGNLITTPPWGGFNFVQDVFVDRSNNIFVADTNNNRIQKFTNNGDLLATFGSGQLSAPNGVGADAQDKVYVADCNNNRIAVYSLGTTYSISGRVTDDGNNPALGVTISASSGSSATTDASGYYTITNAITGAYTITPTKSGYTFSPASRNVIVPPNKTGQDFVAMAPPPPQSCTVPFFSQRDDRWKNYPLRTNGACSLACNTIGACGCTLTSSTMVFAYYGANLTPPALSDCIGNLACPFSWGTGASCTNGKATWVGQYGFSWSRLDQELNQNHRPVILGMRQKANPDNTHWVVVVSGQGRVPGAG